MQVHQHLDFNHESDVRTHTRSTEPGELHLISRFTT